MNVWLFVKVVAILADVVQGGEYGCVVSSTALVRHPAITLTLGIDGGCQSPEPPETRYVSLSLSHLLTK